MRRGGIDAVDEPAAEAGALSRSGRVVFSLLAVGSIALGVVGFGQYLPAHPQYGRGFLDLVYYSLQLFVLDAAPLQTATHLPLTLQIARFAAPAVTAYLILLAVAQRLVRLRIRLMRGHSILCGPPHLTRPLAAQIRGEKGGKVVVVGEQGRSILRPLYLAGDPRNLAVLRWAGLRRARELIAVGPDSVRNAETAIAVHRGNPSVACYAEAQERELFQAMLPDDLHPGEVHRIALFDRHERTARMLLQRLTVPPTGDLSVAALVIGYTGLGRTLIDQLVLFWSRTADPDLCLRVLDADAPPPEVVQRRHADARNRVVLSADRFDPAWLSTDHELRVPVADGTPHVPSRVYVCLEDDAAGIALGETVLGLLAEYETTVVVAVANGSMLGDDELRGVRVRGKARLVLASVMRAAYTITAIRTGANEALARAIHDRYLRAAEARGESPETNASIRPWDTLPDDLKDSSREQAWDIGHMLALVGYSAVPARGYLRKGKLSDADVERLARIEHIRWLNELRAKGWIHNRARDYRRRLHPDMVDWTHLSEESKDKDRSAVRAIPGLLAAAGLMMVRTTA